jgi:cation diffusion facilitator family transporter
LSNFRFQLSILIIGIFLALVKFGLYFLTHSNAICSDALESLVNVSAHVITLYSLYLAAKPRDKNHPYGHGKVEFLAAGIEGAMLFSAGVYTIYKTIEDLFHAHTAEISGWPLIAMIFLGIANYVLGYLSEKQGEKTKSPALIAGGIHLKSDGYISFGIVISLSLVYFFHYIWIDYAVAIIIGLFLIYHGIKVVRSSLFDILDTADENVLTKIIEYLQQKRQVNWIDIHNLRIIKYGSEYHVDAHMTLPWYYTNLEVHTEMKRIHELINLHFESTVELFIHPDPCEEFSCNYCQIENCPERKTKFESTVEWTMENVLLNEKHTLVASNL